jgi:hypothetical protein
MARMFRLLLLLIGAVAAATFVSRAAPEPQSQQAPTRGNAVVIGRVIDGTTGQPIPGAFVTIASSGRPIGQPTMVADSQGRFVFRNLPAGKFDLVATARGYLADDGHAESGMRAPPQAIELADAEQATDTDIRLFKPARISGIIVDDVGDPIEGAQIPVLRVEYIAGHRRLRRGGGSISNDRGFYSSGRLVPGSYVVGVLTQRTTVPVSSRELIDRLAGATAKEQQDFERSVLGSGLVQISNDGFRIGDLILQPGFGGASGGPAPAPDGKLLAAPSLFYPGVSSAAQATAITVGAGDERGGINLHLRLEPSVRVSGRIAGPDGPMPHLAVRLVPDGSDALVSEYPFEQGVTVTNAAGAFTFLAVPSGSYSVKAYWLPSSPRPGFSGAAPPPVDGPTLSGSLPVSVGEADVTDLLLTLRHGPRVLGRIVFDGTASAPVGAQLTSGVIRFELADGRAPSSPPMPPLRAAIGPDGQFHSIGLPAGRYVFRIDAYPGWTLESAMLSGRDLSDDGFDAEGGGDDLAGVVVTLTDAPAGISGVVRTSGGVPAAQAAVLVFSPNSAHWIDHGTTPRRQLRTTTSKTGTFSVSGLPPGEYLALALSGAPPDNWRMPEFLSAASRAATHVTVERRATRTVDLTVGGAVPRGGGR